MHRSLLDRGNTPVYCQTTLCLRQERHPYGLRADHLTVRVDRETDRFDHLTMRLLREPAGHGPVEKRRVSDLDLNPQPVLELGCDLGERGRLEGQKAA